MKASLTLFLVFFGMVFSAQAQKPATKASASSYTNEWSQEQSVTGNLGFTNSAINIGATYEKNIDNVGMGGYFFLQTDKEKNGTKIVRQTTSLGGIIKLHLMNNSKFDAYLAPGFGIHMFKDVDDNGKKSDKTTFGPMAKIGGMLKITPTVAGGIERSAFANWFDENSPSSVEYWSAVISVEL